AMVKKYGKTAKIKTPVNPHLFRHCFASDLIKNGADLMGVTQKSCIIFNKKLDSNKRYV
ncbi:MAG: tyrosine-type recombinase/integrase, partial [Desulfobacterales bacterium]|nr:tyrosine-type recombinase/integrase [Desulfobacterales bacterium]